jgi:hypothetical protein
VSLPGSVVTRQDVVGPWALTTYLPGLVELAFEGVPEVTFNPESLPALRDLIAAACTSPGPH